MKRTISTGLLILFLTLTGSASGQALPPNEQVLLKSVLDRPENKQGIASYLMFSKKRADNVMSFRAKSTQALSLGSAMRVWSVSAE